jgi:hypothetical protein
MFENAGHSILRWLMFGRPPPRRVAGTALALVLRPDGAIRRELTPAA